MTERKKSSKANDKMFDLCEKIVCCYNRTNVSNGIKRSSVSTTKILENKNLHVNPNPGIESKMVDNDKTIPEINHNLLVPDKNISINAITLDLIPTSQGLVVENSDNSKSDDDLVIIDMKDLE